MRKDFSKSALYCALGGYVQWFDYTLFTVMMPLIIGNFVPKVEDLDQTFTYLITYSATLFTRPFGSLIFSHFSDHYGRKKVLIFTVGLMGLSTFLLGICPSSWMIGVAAPAFLLIFMFLHGFSSGGEWPNDAAYLYESSEPKDYAKIGWIIFFWIMLGIFSGHLISTLFIELSSPRFLGKFSWRLLFLLATLWALIALKLRIKLPESKLWVRKTRKFVLKDFLRSYGKPIFQGFLIAASEGALFNLFIHAVDYPVAEPVINRTYEVFGSFLAMITSYGVYKISQKIGAIWSIRMGIGLVVLLAIIQCFLVPAFAHSLYRLAYVIPTVLYIIPVVSVMPSLFPTENRALAVSLSHELAIFLFGGVGLVVIRSFGSQIPHILPAYIGTMAILSLIGTFSLKEVYKRSNV